MITMIISVLWFGHRLGGKQWMGVVLVFGAIGAEAYINIAEKKAKAKAAVEKKN
jgi:UDP-galactose transporter B1